jgi:hypothetical protein
MSVRSLVLGLCLGLVVYSGASLFAAKQEDLMLCCDTSDDCHGGRCCDPSSIGETACSPDKPGICMATCARANGH